MSICFFLYELASFRTDLWDVFGIGTCLSQYEGASVFTWKITRHVSSTHIQYHMQNADLGYVVGCPYEVMLIYVVYIMPFSEKTANLFVLKMGAFSHWNNHHHISKFHCKPLYPPRVSLCLSRVPGSFQNLLYLKLDVEESAVTWHDRHVMK